MAMVNSVADVLVMAGYRKYRQKVVQVISGKFKAINKVSFRLNQAPGEEITSSDLRPVWVSPNLSFDPAGMEDIGGEQDRRQQSDRVLCTTEMGLRRVGRQTKENRSWPETTFLLKPKVALESVTDW
jgi:hypothetical protein